MKVLVVCTGNTCRSPMAEAFLKKFLEDTRVEVFSAGLYAGSAPSKEAREAAKVRGTTVKKRSTQITRSMVESASLILTMEESQKKELIELYGASNVYTISEFAHDKGDVEDPWGGDGEVYSRVADRLYSLSEKVSKRIKLMVDSDNGTA